MTLRIFLHLALIVGWTAWPSSGFAEEPATLGSDETPELAEEQETPDSDETSELVEALERDASSMEHPSLHGSLKLTLAEAIRMGLENNLDVQVERFSPLIAGEEEEIAWGTYDPEFFGSVDYADGDRPTGFLTGGGATLIEETSVGGGTGIRGNVPLLGSSYNLEFTSSRDESDFALQFLSPEYNSSINLSLSQPLLTAKQRRWPSLAGYRVALRWRKPGGSTQPKAGVAHRTLTDLCVSVAAPVSGRRCGAVAGVPWPKWVEPPCVVE